MIGQCSSNYTLFLSNLFHDEANNPAYAKMALKVSSDGRILKLKATDQAAVWAD